jgi:hypothetical protein
MPSAIDSIDAKQIELRGQASRNHSVRSISNDLSLFCFICICERAQSHARCTRFAKSTADQTFHSSRTLRRQSTTPISAQQTKRHSRSFDSTISRFRFCNLRSNPSINEFPPQVKILSYNFVRIPTFAIDSIEAITADCNDSCLFPNKEGLNIDSTHWNLSLLTVIACPSDNSKFRLYDSRFDSKLESSVS